MTVIKDPQAVDTLATAYVQSRGALLDAMASAATSPGASAYASLGSARRQQAASMARVAAAVGAASGSCYTGAADSAVSPSTLAASPSDRKQAAAAHSPRGVGHEAHMALEMAMPGACEAVGGLRLSEGGASTASVAAAGTAVPMWYQVGGWLAVRVWGYLPGQRGASLLPLYPSPLPPLCQVCVLTQRYGRTVVRNPVMMMSELVQYLFLSIFVGLMYCR
jgi:hypothetical protein